MERLGSSKPLETKTQDTITLHWHLPTEGASDTLDPTLLTPEISLDEMGVARFQGDAGRISFDGLIQRVADWRDRRSERKINQLHEKADELEIDAEVYSNAAKASMDSIVKPVVATLTDSEQVEKYRKKHMTKKSGMGFGGGPADPPPATEFIGQARTELQKGAAIRANLRMDAKARKQMEINRLNDHWGESLLESPSAIEAEIKNNGRYTRKQKQTLKQAGRRVRSEGKSIDRITRRLERSRDGTDIPGRVIDARIERMDSRADKIQQRLEERERRRQERRDAAARPRSTT